MAVIAPGLGRGPIGRTGPALIIEFSLPNGLRTVFVASESAIHLPSITREYSQVPGGKRSSFSQGPSNEEVMGFALGCQLLKVPATQTVRAPGWVNSKRTGSNAGQVGPPPLAFVVLMFMFFIELFLHLAVPGGLGVEAEIAKGGFHFTFQGTSTGCVSGRSVRLRDRARRSAAAFD